MLYQSTTRVIKFFDEFYCLGFDKEKVQEGIEDNTELSDIDNTQDWNKGVVASSKKYYKDVDCSKSEMVKLNEDVMCYPEIK